MRKTMIVSASLACLLAPANAQTKDQCSAVTRALIPAQVAIDTFGEKFGKIPNAFEVISSNVSGNFKTTADEGTAAQANLVAAIKRYRIAIEEVVHEAQLCAR